MRRFLVCLAGVVVILWAVDVDGGGDGSRGSVRGFAGGFGAAERGREPAAAAPAGARSGGVAGGRSRQPGCGGRSGASDLGLCGAAGSGGAVRADQGARGRSEEHTSELQSLMRISYAVFCLKKKKTKHYSFLPLVNLVV